MTLSPVSSRPAAVPKTTNTASALSTSGRKYCVYRENVSLITLPASIRPPEGLVASIGGDPTSSTRGPSRAHTFDHGVRELGCARVTVQVRRADPRLGSPDDGVVDRRR